MKIRLDNYKIILEYGVHWGDMDAASHVNNLIYLKWCESARLIYFEKIGIDLSFKGKGIGPILGWQDCKYIFPMTYPDTAMVGIRTYEIQEDRFLLECAVFSKKHQRLAAIAKQTIIPYSYADFKKMTLPNNWLEGIGKIEEGDK